MRKLLIRHEVSEANDKSLPAYGRPEAHLLPLGVKGAKELCKKLAETCYIDPATEPVATSRMLRTQETAHFAGFAIIRHYPILDEATSGLTFAEIEFALVNKQTPYTAIAKAEKLLKNPLEERVWVTHGLVIAGLCEVLGVHKEKRFVPHFGEVRELDI